MNARGFAIGACALLSACASPGFAAQAKPPYELVRSLHALQDQMVLGSTAAKAAIPGLAVQLSQRLLAYPPATWREPRNVRAVVTYVLSGGPPRVARKVLESGNCPPQDKNLVEGALDYSEGHEARARTLLTGVDPRALEPILGGHIALVQAALAAKDNPKKAVELLDVARILAPGTLVEEAALRREIFLVDEIGDFDKFMDMSGQYIRRFGNSAYADNFRHHFSESIALLNVAANPAELQEVDDVLSSLRPEDQLLLYLMIARASIINGKIKTTQFAAAKAEDLSVPASSDNCRARLYDGAAAIFTPDYLRGVSLLQKIDPARLPQEDASLKQAALSVSEQIHEWPQVGGQPLTGAQKAEPVSTDLDSVMTGSDSTMASAQKALSDSDDLLKAKQP